MLSFQGHLESVASLSRGRAASALPLGSLSRGSSQPVRYH